MIVLLSLFLATAAHAQFRSDVSDDRILFVDLPHGQVEITRITADDVFGFWVNAAGAQEVELEGAHIPQWIETHENSALLRLNMGTAVCQAFGS